jgi:hypothetical protein
MVRLVKLHKVAEKNYRLRSRIAEVPELELPKLGSGVTFFFTPP